MSEAWKRWAACRDQDPDWFFPRFENQEVAGLAVCQACAVWKECNEYAKTSNGGKPEVWGVWGRRLRERGRGRQGLMFDE